MNGLGFVADQKAAGCYLDFTKWAVEYLRENPPDRIGLRTTKARVQALWTSKSRMLAVEFLSNDHKLARRSAFYAARRNAMLWTIFVSSFSTFGSSV